MMENCAMDSDVKESKVLAIGDQLKRNPNKKKRPKRDFKLEFTERLGQLLIGDPNAVADDNFVMDQIELNIVKVNDLTQHYVFSINKPSDEWTTYGRTIDAKSVLRATKAKLKNEKWISENVMERTFKNKDDIRFKIDNIVYKAQGDSFDEQDKQIHNYICFLQQEFRRVRKL